MKGLRGGQSLRAWALATAAVTLMLLALIAESASARLFHPQPPVASFGPLGGSCSGGNLASGTGDLSAATGTGDLSLLATGSGTRTLLASGEGDFTEGSKVVTGFSTTSGTFSVGESVSSFTSIPPGTTIEAVGGGTLTLSKPATESISGADLFSGSKMITGLVTDTGAFSVGESISGPGVQEGTTITAVGANTLTLSDGVRFAGSFELVSGSKTITNVTTSKGAFAVGMTYGGVSNNIPTRATITAVGASTLTFSVGVPRAQTGTQLEFGSTEISNVATSCGSFKVDQLLTAPGLNEQPGGGSREVKITAVGASTLTISRPPNASGSGVALSAESSFGAVRSLAFDQAARRLYALDTGKSNAEIPGDLLYGIDLSTPGTYTPLAGFPLAAPSLGGAPGTPVVAVDNSGGPTQGNIYTSTDAHGDNEIHGYDPDGTPLPGFPIPAPPPLPKFTSDWIGMAVDPDGNVWAANSNGNFYEYSPGGALIGTVAGVDFGLRVSLTFDANGDLYYSSRKDSTWGLAAPTYDNPTVLLTDGGLLATDRTTHDLYVLGESKSLGGSSNKFENHIRRYDSGGALVEEFPSGIQKGQYGSIAVDEATGAIYVGDSGGEVPNRIHVFEALTLPDLANGGLSDLTETSATLNGSVDPGGLSLSSCKFEWVSEAAYQVSGFADLSSGGEAECTPAFSSIPSSGQTAISASVTALQPAERYRFRISASNANGTNSSKPVSFALEKPVIETIGSPIRNATSARLGSRIDPHGIVTEYHFEYISEAAYQANLAASQPPFAGAQMTASDSAGSGGLIVLASQTVENLKPDTTYRYRVIADNGSFGGSAIGETRSVETRASDAPFSHGHYPGPPGSDRAWEQVSLPNTSGNPVQGAAGISADGESALYRVMGGTPVSEAGTLFNYLFAQRPLGDHPTSGWQTEQVFPSREQAPFSVWRPPTGNDSLSTLFALNLDPGAGAGAWRLPTTGEVPVRLYEAEREVYGVDSVYIASDDGSRVLLVLEGKHVDPEHESPEGVAQLYDVSSGVPEMLLLPGDTVPGCGTKTGSDVFSLPQNWVARSTHWLSADGAWAFFASCAAGATHLYAHDFAANETFQVDGPLPGGLSGPVGPECSGAMIRSTPDSVYFWTQSRLVEEDTVVSKCDLAGEFTSGGDVYRFDLTAHDFHCLTCVVPGGVAANVNPGSGSSGAARVIAVAPAGPRLYFTTRTHLLPGAPDSGTPAIYRVNTETHQLAYVAPVESGDQVGENPQGALGSPPTAISADGRFLTFQSAAGGLDQLSGSNNGDSGQFYLYDDEERSLSCASCPLDGSAPRAAVAKGIISETESGPNMTSLSNEGTLAFATPTALVNADQNTAASNQTPSAGEDVYEWRDGQALLVSDGLSNWGNGTPPKAAAISPSGRDLFFTEAARLTPDALDGYPRLYDARIGGGIEFPEAKKPCPLEVCQGTPKGAPEEATPGSSSFVGPGNEKPATACAKGKRRVKGRCVARKHHKQTKRHKRAHHKRRASR